MKYINTRNGVVIDIPSQIKTGKGWEVYESPNPPSEVKKTTTPKKKGK